MTEELPDPRGVANLMLDEGDRIGSCVTNLALQKLLYFAHAVFLIERKRPLVSGYFEAWQWGPVHPAAYQAFKTAGDQAITFRATRFDIVTGELAEIPLPSDPDVQRHIVRIMGSYYGFLWSPQSWPACRNRTRQGRTMGFHCRQGENVGCVWVANSR